MAGLSDWGTSRSSRAPSLRTAPVTQPPTGAVARRPRQALQYRTRLRLHHPRQARRGCQAAVRTGGHGTGGQKYPWWNPQSREAVSCWVCDDGLADETIFLIRRSHPETNQCSIRPVREESYDRVRHGSMCFVQHQHLRCSCFRRVSDALMGVDRSTLPRILISPVRRMNRVNGAGEQRQCP